jgi:hypothetical protein
MANATVLVSPPVDNRTQAPRAFRAAFALLRCGLVLGGVGVILSYLFLAATHINDRFQINFCSSVYASLAAYLNTGVLYPELADGLHYGGTRYMPLEFTMHAGLARLTGEYLVSGKLLTYTLTLFLFVQLWYTLRAVGCPRGIVLPAVSFILLTDTGYLACTTIRGDLLPVVCQLAALLLLHRETTTRRAALAGFCCALGLLAKLSALWGPLAITAYLLLRHRRYLAVFLTVTIVSVGVTILACQWGSAGRMYANFAALSAAGATPKDVVLSPVVLLWKLGHSGIAVAFLVPALVGELVAAATQNRHTLFHYGAYACFAVTLVIFADRGSDYNHLLDLIAFAVIMCGSLWGKLPSARAGGGAIRPALALAMLWILFTAWANTLVLPVVSANRAIKERSVDPHFTSPPLAGLINSNDRVLAEDAWIELSRGRLPTVLDSYAVARLAGLHPEMTEPLARRVEAREFACLILLQRMDATGPATDRYRWEERAFGPEIVAAMRRNYRYFGDREGYVIYVPVAPALQPAP